VPLQPFVEYHAEIVTADADPAYADVMGAGGRDRQWLAFGLRARVYKGITLDAGTDVRITSTAAKYGPPLPPYDVVVGAAYPLDIDAFRRPVVVTKTVEKQVIKEVPPPPSGGEIAGTVNDTKDGKPLAGAIVALKGRPHARVATDPDGSFSLQGVPPGPVDVEVWAPSFDPEQVTTSVAAGRTARVTVALSRRIDTGVVRGKVTDTGGKPVEASLHFSGAQAYDARSDAQGLFQATLTPGAYKLAVDAPALDCKEAVFDLVAGQEQQLDLGLRAPNPDVLLSGDTITLRQPIRLRVGTPRLAPRDQSELDGVAALLDDHPEIHMLRVEAHWDASAGLTAKTLTQQQAQAIKDYLVKKGIGERRIDAVGMGSDQPLVPSIGPGNRSRNRRVELRVTY
jgi:outer membrane protein OmpA-like peptidoglycan-associated protein